MTGDEYDEGMVAGFALLLFLAVVAWEAFL